MSAADRAREERAAQGLPEHITDEGVLDQVARLLAGSEDAGGGPVQPARRRRYLKTSTAAIKRAQDDGR